MAKRKKTAVSQPRQPAHAPLFDQNAAPPPPRRSKRSGMQQIELDLGPLPAGASAGRAQPPRKGGKRRPDRARAARRRVTRGEMRRRRRNRRILLGLLIAALMITGVVLSFTVLFKVETITVQNLDRSTPADTGPYPEESLIAALGVSPGDQLYSFDAAEKAAQLALEFPLLETIQVYQHIPSTVILRVQPAVATYCVETAAGWATLSSQFKVMELSSGEPAGLLRITGLSVETPVPGTFLQLAATPPEAQTAGGGSSASDPAASDPAGATPAPTSEPEDRTGDLALLQELLTALGEGDTPLLARVTALDMTRLTELSFVYDGRVTVLLGTSNSLDYKLQLAREILTGAEGLSASDRGTLDVSHIGEDGSIRPVFSPA